MVEKINGADVSGTNGFGFDRAFSTRNQLFFMTVTALVLQDRAMYLIVMGSCLPLVHEDLNILFG